MKNFNNNIQIFVEKVKDMRVQEKTDLSVLKKYLEGLIKKAESKKIIDIDNLLKL